MNKSMRMRIGEKITIDQGNEILTNLYSTKLMRTFINYSYYAKSFKNQLINSNL